MIKYLFSLKVLGLPLNVSKLKIHFVGHYYYSYSKLCCDFYMYILIHVFYSPAK